MNDHTCDLCSLPVVGRSTSARYCSTACRGRAKRARNEAARLVPCRGCGAMKSTDAAGRRRGSVLCHDCRRRSPAAPRVDEVAKWGRRKRTPCSKCGGPIPGGHRRIVELIVRQCCALGVVRVRLRDPRRRRWGGNAATAGSSAIEILSAGNVRSTARSSASGAHQTVDDAHESRMHSWKTCRT